MMRLVRPTSFWIFPITGCQRSISTTPLVALDRKWRESRGLPQNQNAFGSLTNLPDYTFMDGRPTPLGMNLTKRLARQKAAASEMVEKIRELDFAKERYAKIQREKEESREQIISSKLKPKGHLLLKK